MNGFFNLYKPSGMTSALLVHLVKKKTGAKCGHMGTLDPMASGVLPVGIGKANRLFEYLLDKEKEYAAEFTFGAETDTLDKTGAVTQTSEYLPAREELEALLPRFVGEIEQVPPRYSAKNVGGRRGYDLARRGVEFTLPPKKVTVTSYRLTGQPGRGVFSFLIRCKGVRISVPSPVTWGARRVRSPICPRSNARKRGASAGKTRFRWTNS